MSSPAWLLRYVVAALVAAGVVLGPPAATSAVAEMSDHGAARSAFRGAVVSAARVDALSAQRVRAYLAVAGFDPSLTRYGLRSYRLVYRTVDVAGRPTTASGLVAFPGSGARVLPVVSYTHGTMAAKSDAPSVSPSDTRAAVYTFAASGFAAVAPDYLGLGLGPGFHPYMHVSTEASASLDLLRAVRRFAFARGLVLRAGVHVSGFSQGGAAAMALGRSLSRHDDRYFRLAALAPISGPYDLRGAELPAALSGRLNPRDSAFYLAYALTAWNRIYHLYDDPAQVFRTPYASFVDGLFDGTHSDQEVFTRIAPDPEQLLTPHWLWRLRHPAGRLAAALAQTDGVCTTWTPRVPVHLLATHRDEQVAYDNSRRCAAALRQRGVRVTVTDLAERGHFSTQVAGVPAVLRYFDRHEECPSR
jgi:CTP:molybdopterin cytidylyltransferase MocA